MVDRLKPRDNADVEEAVVWALAEGKTLAPREGVTLRQRAWPLVEMMKRSMAEKADIVWGV